MNKRKAFTPVIIPLLVAAVIALAAWFVLGHHAAILTPRGTIGSQERHLMGVAAALMMIVVIPVFIFTGLIVWRYRADNLGAKYTPDADGHRGLEALWWGIPCAIILVLAVLTWQASHSLDPFKRLSSDQKPLVIQVVALDWKWLFIYPAQNIATVNYVQFPENTPVIFQITADAPMNSFWIPQLGGQIYAMPGMSTELNLMAGGTGTYAGSSANLSGSGFAGMRFTARSTSAADFANWVAAVKKSPKQLTTSEYARLAQPSQNNPVAQYSSPEPGLYNDVVMQYMMPLSQITQTDGKPKGRFLILPGLDF